MRQEDVWLRQAHWDTLRKYYEEHKEELQAKTYVNFENWLGALTYTGFLEISRTRALKRLYDVGLEILREHSEEICVRVMKSRSEDKGNFAYLDDEDIKRERRAAKFLQHLLWRMNLELKEETDKDGYCDKKCYDCTYKRYRFHSLRAPDHWTNQSKEGWYCQAECECK